MVKGLCHSVKDRKYFLRSPSWSASFQTISPVAQEGTRLELSGVPFYLFGFERGVGLKGEDRRAASRRPVSAKVSVGQV